MNQFIGIQPPLSILTGALWLFLKLKQLSKYQINYIFFFMIFGDENAQTDKYLSKCFH